MELGLLTACAWRSPNMENRFPTLFSPKNMSLQPKKNTLSQSIAHNLAVEPLEERMMLSTVEIFAAGSTGHENLDLFIDGAYETTFFNVGGDVSAREFESFLFKTDRELTPGNIGVAFGNDFFDPATGVDSNLLVDRIVVDGVTVQTEDPTTFSTGIYRDGLTGPGFFETELFNVNAIFTYADPASDSGGGGGGAGDLIEFDVLGTTGEEIVDLVVDGETVASFTTETAGAVQTFSFASDDPNISIEDVRLEFNNDLFDPEAGIDRNVQIFEFRVIDSATGQVEKARTTDANVQNLGIFVPGVGVTSALGAGGFLAANGFVEISEAGPTSLVPDSSFQATDVVFSSVSAVGPSDQVAIVDTLLASPFEGSNNEILVVGSDGVPLSSFGGDGRVNIDDLLTPRIGIDNPVIEFDDIDFFDDGSLLLVGNVRSADSSIVSPRTPVIAKLSPDGTLDESFSQQGILSGTFLQLNGFPNQSVLNADIDSEGRVIVFGTNLDSFLAPTNFVVSRLNADGSLDSSFGNGGNVFIAGSDLSSTASDGTGEVAGVDVDPLGNITFGAAFNELGGTVAIGRLFADGSRDFGFADGGVFSQPTVFSRGDAFQVTNAGTIVVSVTAVDERVPAVSFLTSSGDLISETILTPPASIGTQGVTLPSFVGTNDLVVDQDGNVLIRSSVSDANFPPVASPSIIQRVLANGEVDTSLGFGGAAIVESVDDLNVDSQNRLIVVSDNLSRVEIA